MEQQTHTRVFHCFLPTYPSTKSCVTHKRGFDCCKEYIYGTKDPSKGFPLFATHRPFYQKLRDTKDPYEGFRLWQGTHMEQRGFQCLLPTSHSTIALLPTTIATIALHLSSDTHCFTNFASPDQPPPVEELEVDRRDTTTPAQICLVIWPITALLS